MIQVDLTNTGLGDIKEGLLKRVAEASAKIYAENGADNKWVWLPDAMGSEIARIKDIANKIRASSDALLVIGIGGSYLGAAAGLQMLDGDFPVEFLGTSFDPTPVHRFLEKYKGKRISVNVISKSGGTLEISSVFDIIKKHVPKEFWYFTTDANKGVLREMANRENIPSFVVPDGVGGRYSVLSAVGLLPLAVAGIDVDTVIKGSQDAYKQFKKDSTNNQAFRYAIARHLLHEKHDKKIEVLASFYEGFGELGQWWQQLFGESEGKDGKGIFPCSMVFSRDLHSMGQYIQQGAPILFETLINIVEPPKDIANLNKINKAAFMGTLRAHADAGVPVVVINVPKIDAYNFGVLTYFFQIACACSAYLLGVNPFDQPGVEFYKAEMNALLRE